METGQITGASQITPLAVTVTDSSPLLMILHTVSVDDPYRHGIVNIALRLQSHQKCMCPQADFPCQIPEYLAGVECISVFPDPGTVCFTFPDIIRCQNPVSGKPEGIQKICEAFGIT